MAATTADGRYSIHDHLFDFSRSEVACGECHDAGDERLARTATHVWNILPVRFPQPLTIEQNCVRCHGDKDASWIQAKFKAIKRRL